MNKVTLTSVRKVKGGKYQIEIAQLIDNPTQSLNVAGLLNKSDSRFKQAEKKPRRAWASAEAAQLKEYFGLDVATLKFDKEGMCAVSIENPMIDGFPLQIQITEGTAPFYAGQKPKQSTDVNGVTRYFMVGGKHIYSKTSIVAIAGEVEHKILKSDALVEEKAKVTAAAQE